MKIIGILAGIVLLVWILSLWAKRYGSADNIVEDIKKEADSWGKNASACASCTGSCSTDNCSLPRAKGKAPVYFDDEELDRFAGRRHTDYSPEEVEEFRAVLTTLLPEEVEQWLGSLNQRLIAFPAALMEQARDLIQAVAPLDK